MKYIRFYDKYVRFMLFICVSCGNTWPQGGQGQGPGSWAPWARARAQAPGARWGPWALDNRFTYIFVYVFICVLHIYLSIYVPVRFHIYFPIYFPIYLFLYFPIPLVRKTYFKFSREG